MVKYNQNEYEDRDAEDAWFKTMAIMKTKEMHGKIHHLIGKRVCFVDYKSVK